MPDNESPGYVYLDLPPAAEMSGCAGLVLAGLVARAKIGVGGLEEAVEVLESLHSGEEHTRYRFCWTEEAVVAEVEDSVGGSEEDPEWRMVVELVA